MKRENKGITLISLVITIIILIILAGVAINLSLGENGIFTKAKQARNEYINAESSEQESLNVLVDQLWGEKKLVTGIVLSKTSTKIYVGESETLETTIKPTNATDKRVKWTSGDSNVVTVSNGTITGVAEGTAIITATAVDGSGIIASCEVVVEENITDISSEESMRKLCNSSTDKISEKLNDESFRNDLFTSNVFQNVLVDIGKDANIIEVFKTSSQYKEEIANILESSWTEKLNTIAFWSETDCWLYHEGNFCIDITGGWGYTDTLTNYNKSTININGSTYMEINANNGTTQAGSIYTLSKIKMSSYNKITFDFIISNAHSTACGNVRNSIKFSNYMESRICE